MNAYRMKMTPMVTKGAVAFTAAVAVNVALFSMVTALNRTVDIAAAAPADDDSAFSLQELPPPEPTVTPPEEPEPPPKREVTETAPANTEATPSPEPPLALGLGSLGADGVMVNVGPRVASAPAAAATVRPHGTRVFQRGEVDRPVRAVACATPSRAPAVARRRGLSASVRIRAVIDPKGGVRSARAVSGSGSDHPAFQKEALRHFKSCRFEPASKDGHAVSQWVERVYEFEGRG
jgi:TonB family protein